VDRRATGNFNLGHDGTQPGPFGPFELLRPVARGGMSIVWAADDERGGHCVVKLLRAVFLADEAARRRFLEEADLLSRFDHPNIVKVITSGEHQSRLYVALEHVQGATLRALMNEVSRRGRVLPPAAASRVIVETLRALHHAHTRRDPKTGVPLSVVHRDVSPQNVMVCADGAVRLLDFGLATSTLFSFDDKHSAVHGTLPYMSPEQVSGEHVDARSDQYACAVILYELLLGRPFFGGLLAEQAVELLGRGYLPPGLDVLEARLKETLTHALAVRVDKRFPDAGAFADALEAALPPLDPPAVGALVKTLAPL
jgi:serine/threonine protein kinase